MAPKPKVVEVAIIGAGWSGLVTAKTYLQLRTDVNLLVIDSDNTVGGVWSAERLYPNLVAQVKHGFFNFTDTPMPVSNDGMVTGDMIHDYLQAYAEDHDLLRRIRFNTFVSSVERCERGWRIHFKDSQDTVETEKLLVSPGVASIPTLPSLSINDQSVPMIHSKELGVSLPALESEKVQRVVVLGAAKSAYDAVYLLLKLGKKVTWVIRPNGAGPLAILPSNLFGYFTSIGVASTRIMTYLSPSILNTKGILASFFHRTTIGRFFTRTFWGVTNYVCNLHDGYNKSPQVASLKPDIDPLGIFYANSGLGVVTLPDFWKVIHDGDVEIAREFPQSISQGFLQYSSGRSIAADQIVACTGWGDHFGMFDASLKSEMGLPGGDSGELSWVKDDIEATKSVNEQLPLLNMPVKLKNPLPNNPQQKWRLFRRAIPLKFALENDRSFAILNQLHTVQTPLVAEVQALWTISYLLGDIDLPQEAEMRKEIAEWSVWTKKRYLSQGDKYPYSIYDFLPYVDTLCRDLGIKSNRKGNPFSEMFSPYKPEDFNGLIDEYLAKRREMVPLRMT